MKSAPHFGVRCPPCGELVAFPIPAARANDDPVLILRSLSREDQREVVAFMAKHGAHKDVGPCVVDIEPMGTA